MKSICLHNDICSKTKTVSAKSEEVERRFETISIFQDLLLGSHCCFDLSGGLEGWWDIKIENNVSKTDVKPWCYKWVGGTGWISGWGEV